MPFETPEEWESELSQFMDTVKSGDPPASIKDAVRDDTWRQILAYYANENLVMENVAFISALVPYIDSGSMNMDQGKKIYDQFVSSDAAQQVNLPGTIRKELDEIYTKEEPIAPPNHYDAAFNEIVSMCDMDTYRRFKDTAGNVKAALNG